MKLFKFQWQNVKEDYLGPGFAATSPQWKSKFGMQRNKNVAIFVVLGSLGNNRRWVVVFLVSMQLQKWWTLLRWSKVTQKVRQILKNSWYSIYFIIFHAQNFVCTKITWEIIHVKEQTCTLLILIWYGCRNCTKLVSKLLAAKNSLSISVLCIASFL